jgi:hypothetical protein
MTLGYMFPSDINGITGPIGDSEDGQVYGTNTDRNTLI